MYELENEIDLINGIADHHWTVNTGRRQGLEGSIDKDRLQLIRIVQDTKFCDDIIPRTRQLSRTTDGIEHHLSA